MNGLVNCYKDCSISKNIKRLKGKTKNIRTRISKNSIFDIFPCNFKFKLHLPQKKHLVDYLTFLLTTSDILQRDFKFKFATSPKMI